MVYLSTGNPIEEIFTYGACLFITKINNDLKVVKKYIFGDEMLLKDKFEGGQGLEDISFKILKKPIYIELYLEPLDDKNGMEHYLKDINFIAIIKERNFIRSFALFMFRLKILRAEM